MKKPTWLSLFGMDPTYPDPTRPFEEFEVYIDRLGQIGVWCKKCPEKWHKAEWTWSLQDLVTECEKHQEVCKG
jgi:hypothetical protein